ncbi:hypothetical protein GWI33_007909 [Rhynchophorus ferrugineus]|uniref:Uncharacterized protein n=1 Tax=Rhynchophorus ferrugineus TaxID=354439 RepID=A0A834MBJ3_RHYFE|nr:hypothetical protein GWI33_007909 [Rhynchophorus ferrugineus]
MAKEGAAEIRTDSISSVDGGRSTLTIQARTDDETIGDLNWTASPSSKRSCGPHRIIIIVISSPPRCQILHGLLGSCGFLEYNIPLDLSIQSGKRGNVATPFSCTFTSASAAVNLADWSPVPV